MNERRRHIMLLVLSVIALGFVILTILVHVFPASAIDVEFSREVQEHRNSFIDEMMYLISAPGYMPEAPLIVGSTSFAFFIFKYKKAALYTLFTLLAGLVSTILKAVVNRPRPSDTLVRIVSKTTQQSFPSGHVLFYVVFFGFMVILMFQLENIPKSIRIIVGGISLLMIFLIPVSRIYLGAHWLSDVLGGFLSGLLCLYSLSWFYLQKPANKKEAPIPEKR